MRGLVCAALEGMLGNWCPGIVITQTKSCESAGEPGGLGEQKWLVQVTALVEKDGSPFLLRMWLQQGDGHVSATAKLTSTCCACYSLLPVSTALSCTGAVTCLHQLMLLSLGYEVWHDRIGLFFRLKKKKKSFNYISLFLLFLGIVSNGAINFGCVQYKNAKRWKCIWFNVWLKFHWSQTGQVCQGHFQYGPNFMPVITL